MTTEPPNDDDDRPADDDGADASAAVDPEAFELDPNLSRLPPDLAALAIEIQAVTEARSRRSTVPLVRFDHFEVEGFRIGGMGLVLQAHDPDLDRRVAIKLWMRDGPKAEAALLKEAKKLARLSHPNVVTVYETGTWNGRVYFVMEWVDGVDGHEWLHVRRSWQEIRAVFLQAARGLAAAHAAGILHRDFKPPNMLIGYDGRVRVCDFGIADTITGEPRTGSLSTPGGTIQYMAPERLLGMAGDARADLFSFCVSLWEALFGVRPFAESTREQLLESIQALRHQGHVVSPDRPEWLTLIALYGFAYRPSERYQSIDEIVRALEDEEAPDSGEDEDEHGASGLGGEGPPPILHEPAQPQHPQDACEAVEHGRSSPLAQPPKPRWAWVSFWAGLGVGVFGLVTYVAGAWSARWTMPPSEDKHELVGEASEVIITPKEVIWHIEAGTYDAEIEKRWTKQYNRWLLEGRPTYDDNLAIATAFLQRAKQLKERGDDAAAVEAKVDAKVWCDAARTDLKTADRPTKPADALEELIQQFENELASGDQSKQVTDPSALLAP